MNSDGLPDRGEGTRGMSESRSPSTPGEEPCEAFTTVTGTAGEKADATPCSTLTAPIFQVPTCSARSSSSRRA